MSLKIKNIFRDMATSHPMLLYMRSPKHSLLDWLLIWARASFLGEGEIDPKWPLNKRFSKIGQNLPEGDIFIKHVKNPLYLRNIGDKKWSPFMDLCYEKVPFLHLKSPKVTVLAYKKKRDLRRLNPKRETTFCRQHSLDMKDLTPVWYGYHL